MKNNIKIVVGVLTHESRWGFEGYDLMTKAAKETCYKIIPDNIELFYLYGHRKNVHIPPNSYKIDGDCFCYDCPEEGWKNILSKTVAFFEYVCDNKDFDFLLRPCIGNYISLPLLNNFVIKNNIPREKVYLGNLVDSQLSGQNGSHFYASGSGYLMSRDVVQLIVDNKHLLEYDGNIFADDSSIGKFLSEEFNIECVGPSYKTVTLEDIINDNSLISREHYNYYIGHQGKKKEEDHSYFTGREKCFYEIHKIISNLH